MKPVSSGSVLGHKQQAQPAIGSQMAGRTAPAPVRLPVPLQALPASRPQASAVPSAPVAMATASPPLPRKKPVITITIPVTKAVADAAAAANAATAAGKAADAAAHVAAGANAKSAALANAVLSSKAPNRVGAVLATPTANVSLPLAQQQKPLVAPPPPVSVLVQTPVVQSQSAAAPAAPSLGQNVIVASNGLRSKPKTGNPNHVLPPTGIVAGEGNAAVKAATAADHSDHSDHSMVDEEMTTGLPVMPAAVHVDADGKVTVPTAETSATAAGAAAGALILAPAFEFGDNEHVTIWNRLECRKIAGNAAPLGKNVYRYLDQHTNCEVYYNQDKAGLGERSAKKRRLMEGENTTLAGDHVPIWNRRERRKIAGNAAPLKKNLEVYLAKRPDCERYDYQDGSAKDAELPTTPRRKAIGNEAAEVPSQEDVALPAAGVCEAVAEAVSGTGNGVADMDFLSAPLDDLHSGSVSGVVLVGAPDVDLGVGPVDLSADALLGGPHCLDNALGGSIINIDRMLASPEPETDKLDTSDWANFSGEALQLPGQATKCELESAADFFLNMDLPQGDDDGDVSLAVMTGPGGQVLDSPNLALDLKLLTGDGEDDDLIDVMPSNNFASAPDLVF